MSKTITIPLTEPITRHGKTHAAIVLRKPVWSDIIGVGAPYTIHRDKEDKPFLVYDEAAIAHYVERCVVEPGLLDLEEADMADALAVREAVVDFFLAAGRGGAGSTTSPKSSGSNAGSSPTPSGA